MTKNGGSPQKACRHFYVYFGPRLPAYNALRCAALGLRCAALRCGRCNDSQTDKLAIAMTR